MRRSIVLAMATAVLLGGGLASAQAQQPGTHVLAAPRSTAARVYRVRPRGARLARQLRLRLPAGTDLDAAASGFDAERLFVAAVNASHNLGLRFDYLKTMMVDDGMTLRQAIQTLRPRADARAEARRAEREAAAMTRGR
ncbi:MAG TPA: hypothetical protein VFX12_05745 [Vicinamibacterales bacterium]|nr:hypothetical protein [Vicinamibacterales bacterium]